mmetsp:Transcript_1023/g.2851  ORF Transcript_1023/g.2851 Transcript_1023/m.2851 type:complete len:276 (-) Transcript_1023:52-879(-)
MFGRHGDLESIFASVPTACDSTSFNAIQGCVLPRHKGHLHQINRRWQEFRHGFRGTRSLQGQELHGILQIVHAHFAVKGRHLFFKMLHITKLSGTIDHHVNVISGIGNHGIVNNASLFVGYQGQAALPGSQSCNVAHDNLFQKLGSILSVPANLAHVRNVKQGGFAILATPQVFLHDTTIFALVQDGQFVSGKGHHVPSHFFVKFVQGCFDQFFFSSRSRRHGATSSRRAAAESLPKAQGRCSGGGRRCFHHGAHRSTNGFSFVVLYFSLGEVLQ